MPYQEHSNGFRAFLTIWCFFENILFSGLRAGWPALVYILKRENVYGHLCKSKVPEVEAVDVVLGAAVPLVNFTYDRKIRMDEGARTYPEMNEAEIETYSNESSLLPNMTSISEKCPEQDAIFNQCFTIATAAMALSALIYGHLNYKFDIRVPRTLSSFLFAIGAICTAFTSQDTPWLIFPGLLLLSTGGMALYLTNIQISYMYKEAASAIVGLLCGALEASSFVMTIIKIAYEKNIDYKISFLILGGLYGLTLVSTFFFFPLNLLSKTQSIKSEAKKETKNSKVDAHTNEHYDSRLGNDSDSKTLVIESSHDSCFEAMNSQVASHRMFPNDSNKDKISGPVVDDQGVETRFKVDYHKPEFDGDRKDTKREKTLRQCFFSRTYLLYLMWSSVVQIVLAMCLGSYNAWINDVTDRDLEEVSRMTDVLLYSMLGSPLLALAIGVGMDVLQNRKSKGSTDPKQRTLQTTSVSLATTSLLALLVCLTFMSKSRDITFFSCMGLVVFRTALYSCGTAFVRIMYPQEYFGILCGVMAVLAGVMSFLQYPLFLWVQHSGSDAWMEVFGFLGVMSIVSLSHPIFLYIKGLQFAAMSDKSSCVVSRHTCFIPEQIRL